jgi:4-hydroxy-4-methyl-2-oxoglutarate aldolase
MDNILDLLGKYPTATLFEAAKRHGAMDPAIKPLHRDMRIKGEAFTVLCEPYDNLAVHRALADNISGKVLVIDTGQGTSGTYCGGIIAKAAKERGAVGIVLNGFVRDFQEIQELDFSIFCRGTALSGSKKSSPGSLQAPVVCCGVLISPEDYVFGDDDGVIIIGRSEAGQVLDAARKRDEFEKKLIKGILSGKTTLELFGLSGKEDES